MYRAKLTCGVERHLALIVCDPPPRPSPLLPPALQNVTPICYDYLQRTFNGDVLITNEKTALVSNSGVKLLLRVMRSQSRFLFADLIERVFGLYICLDAIYKVITSVICSAKCLIKVSRESLNDKAVKLFIRLIVTFNMQSLWTFDVPFIFIASSMFKYIPISLQKYKLL